MSMDVETLQRLVAPLFPGLMGIDLIEAAPERIVAQMKVRPDLCTAGAP
jgi:1,4-dihydroxy-2-naphthoyl-CoA hydrolase